MVWLAFKEAWVVSQLTSGCAVGVFNEISHAIDLGQICLGVKDDVSTALFSYYTRKSCTEEFYFIIPWPPDPRQS